MSREVLADLLSVEADFEVVGMAENGAVAVRLASELNPDVISMDLKMPVMGGFEAIEIIMSENPRPILVVSDSDSAETAFLAISKGALDLYPKKEIGGDNPGGYAAKLRMLSRVKVIRHLKHTYRPSATHESDTTEQRLPFHPTQALKGIEKYGIVAIASSTGGPGALVSVLAELEGCPVPVVVSQHMDDGFVDGFVKWLASSVPLRVKIAADGEKMCPGTVYFAPPAKHIKVAATQTVMIVDRMPGDIYHPSCDLLLSSVGDIYGDRGIGIILTGMGSDGVEGLGLIHRKGGMTIAQDESSSIIFGMPAVAAAKGYAGHILPLLEIGKSISWALMK